MEFQRLSVNINNESAAILRQVRESRGWSTTECIRVAIELLGCAETARKALEEKEETTDDQDLRGE